MLKFKKILVARDFSESSDAAFRYALRLAEGSAAEVHTLFAEVISGPTAPREAKGDDGGELACRHVVERVIVRDTAAAPAILDYAESHDVDLIVMGTHGRRGLRRLFMGSVAEEVVRLSRCPVLTVHASAEGDELVVRDILVPIDFSRHARTALQEAVALAKDTGASLDLLHVLEEPLHPAFYNSGAFSMYDLQPEIVVRAEKRLREFYREVGSDDVNVRFHVRPGRTAKEIVAFADENRSGLIITSTHGLTGLEHLVIGSVAEKVTRNAPCPVLTVKSARHEVEEPADRPELVAV